MIESLMKGLNVKDMQAEVNTYDLKPYYYPTLFPLVEKKTLTWKMLEAQAGLRIAADVVNRGATIPKKVRRAIERIQGDMPKIAISRDKNEDELTEYDIQVAMASGSADLIALVEFWAEDTEFCFTGVAAKCEYIALKSISTGRIKFTGSNNSVNAIEYDVDYGMPTENKIGVGTTYNDVSGKPLSIDFPAAIKRGKAIGVKYQYAFMTPETFEKLASQDEVIKRCATVLANITSIADVPDVSTVNSYLMKKNATFKGLQIVIIDQDITIEDVDGNQVTENPFEQDVILFSPSKVLGHTFWKKPIDMNVKTSAVKVMRGHTMVQKYANEAPLKETTEGIANLFPAWNLATKSVLMQVSATSWTKD